MVLYGIFFSTIYVFIKLFKLHANIIKHSTLVTKPKYNTRPSSYTHNMDSMKVKLDKRQLDPSLPNLIQPMPLSQSKVHLVPPARSVITYDQTFLARERPMLPCHQELPSVCHVADKQFETFETTHSSYSSVTGEGPLTPKAQINAPTKIKLKVDCNSQAVVDCSTSDGISV